MAWGGIGSYAGQVFTVSSWKVLTPSNIAGSTSSNWASHPVFGQKEKSEYIGPGLQTYKFDIVLSSQFGVNPRRTLDTLKELCEKGAIDYFIINNAPVAQNPFMLTDISDTWDAVHRLWGLKSCKVSLTLKEYAI